MLVMSESSFSEVFWKKGVLRNFAKFTGKHLCQFPATLLKKRLLHRCFLVTFVKFPRTPFLTEELWWLLLEIILLRKRIQLPKGGIEFKV